MCVSSAGDEAVVVPGELPSSSASFVNERTTRMPESVSSTCALMFAHAVLVSPQATFITRLKCTAYTAMTGRKASTMRVYSTLMLARMMTAPTRFSRDMTTSSGP